ncbi:Ldh family oxidoreductase [SAR202 cluster bacterium AD-804-J14_MRT_500m]|nr:Ldh family oxidoreductase [SAR202 cluster bacterium AD-804-J14_MRT_500m]
MLEQFKIQENDLVRVDEASLRNIVSAVFEKMGVPEDDAILASDVLVSADLRAVDTHGVSNLLRNYVSRFQTGMINPRPEWRIIRETPATATIDADAGHGIIVTPKAMDIAISKAKDTGIGMVTINNARHLGMASYHAMRALKHDMIGVCMTSCPPTVIPTFAAETRLGTNPIALAAPAKNEPPFVFDAATSVIPDNKVLIARRLGIDLLPGWLADDQGAPVMESIPAPDPHRLVPLGSTREMGSHKGYSLGCVVEILCSVLSGDGFGAIRPRGTFAHYVAAYSIEAFTDTLEFKEMMDDFLRSLKATPPAPGHERVLVAGQLEWEAELDRREHGIPLHKEVIQWVQDVCAELSIPFSL